MIKKRQNFREKRSHTITKSNVHMCASFIHTYILQFLFLNCIRTGVKVYAHVHCHGRPVESSPDNSLRAAN